MAKFIEVTQYRGERLIINTDFIDTVSTRLNDSEVNATIFLTGENNQLQVKETYEEIKAMLEVVNG